MKNEELSALGINDHSCCGAGVVEDAADHRALAADKSHDGAKTMISKEQVKPGAIVRFEDGSTYDVLLIKDDVVVLNGPRPCRGMARCSLDELLREGEFVGEVQRRREPKR